jgi:hypothetical protein
MANFLSAFTTGDLLPRIFAAVVGSKLLEVNTSISYPFSRK